MMGFYTKSDRRKYTSDLAIIDSFNDYYKSISKLEIDLLQMQNLEACHKDYKFVENYIVDEFRNCKRVVFLGVYDCVKEAYFLNKFPNKKFLLVDVNDYAISKLKIGYSNIEILESDIMTFQPSFGDLVIINIAEYYLDQTQLIEVVNKCENIMINNTHIYKKSINQLFWSFVLTLRAKISNYLSKMTKSPQFQFRGWYRTLEDYYYVSTKTRSTIRKIKFNDHKLINTRFGSLNSGFIHFKK